MRRAYLDWLRGIAVLIMIEAHVIDAWTQPGDRTTLWFRAATVLGGFGAPLFLFLAGIAVALSAESKLRKTKTVIRAAAIVGRRGFEIFGLAFLFRLQSFLLNAGGNAIDLLKVDILNIMGLSIVGAAILWGCFGGRWTRFNAFLLVTILIPLLTPIVREAEWLARIADPIEWYLRPSPGHTNFVIFPWAGFVSGGVLVGLLFDAAERPQQERAVIQWSFLAGVGLAAGAYAASLLPTIYHRSAFWTSSPTFFFMRLGLLMVAVAGAYAWSQRPTAGRRYSPLEEMGRSSLFIYWIHVEMVYGVLSSSLHRRLPLAWTTLAFVGFAVAMWATAELKNALKRKVACA